MKYLVPAIRIVVGALFIFSGLIKANDPLGLAYKMDEYFAIWHWGWASAFSLPLSIGMNILEIVAGIALLPSADAAGGFLTGLGFTGWGWLMPLALPLLAAAVAFAATRTAAVRKLKDLP